MVTDHSITDIITARMKAVVHAVQQLPPSKEADELRLCCVRLVQDLDRCDLVRHGKWDLTGTDGTVTL